MTTRTAGYRRTHDLLRGLGAAAVLATFILGVPFALLAFGADPRQLIPDEWPELAEVREWPSQAWHALRWAYYDGSLAPTILQLAVWTAWLVLIWLVLAELAGQLRRGAAAAAHQQFVLANPHSWICSLVTALLLLISPQTDSPSPAASAQIVATVHHDSPIGTPITSPTASVERVRPPANGVYDSLWHIAERRLGAGSRRPETDPAVSSVVSSTDTTHTPAAAATVVVQPPRDGIHDSLWRIAERALGDGHRWPEIFALNKNKPQPNGGRFTNPNLIFPGEVLALPVPPDPAAPPPHGEAEPPPTSSPPPEPKPAPPSSAPTTGQTPADNPGDTSAPATAPAPAGQGDPGPGIGWGTEVFVGLGLAAAVSAALVVARRRYRSRYRPGSGRRDDLPVAPVVYQLRLAHLRVTEPDEDNVEHGDHRDDGDDHGRDDRTAISRPPLVVGSAGPPADSMDEPPITAPAVGVRDGREIALNLAVAHGLGLVGGGASAAARALLITLLSTDHTAGQAGHPPGRAEGSTEGVVIVPQADLAALLGRHPVDTAGPSRLHVAADLDTALDALDTVILRRTRDLDANPDMRWPAVVLVASPSPGSTRRLEAVLDNGAALGIVGLLLGQWRSGVTAHIRADGTVSATNPGVGEQLRGTRAFRLPDTDTADLLALLRQAQRQAQPATNHHTSNATTHDETADATVEGLDTEPAARSDTLHQPARPDPTQAGQADDSELEITAITATEPDGAEPRPGDGAASPQPVPDAPRAHDEHGEHDEHGADGPAARRPIVITVLGPPRVRWLPSHAANDSARNRSPARSQHSSQDDTGYGGGDGKERDITAAFPPKQRELLVFLALHPDGVARDTIVVSLWSTNPPDRPTNALNTALTRLRRAVSKATDGAVPDIITVREGRYQLTPDLVDVDYWQFSDAVTARRAAATDPERIVALQHVVACYGGRLADGLDSEWIEGARHVTGRDAIDAVAALARAVVESDPEYTLDLLETARAFDPHNELLYRDIMRLQERLGRLDAIPRTLDLLATRLAEINEQPAPNTVRLATRLQHHDPPLPPHSHHDRTTHRNKDHGGAAAS